MKEYREVIFEAPFQFQADLLFVMRAMGILAGMATHLDPDFDVWSRTIPYAERYAKEKLKTNRSEWRQEIEQIGQMLFKIPSRVDRVLSHIERGDMMVQSALAPGTRKAVQRLETAQTPEPEVEPSESLDESQAAEPGADHEKAEISQEVMQKFGILEKGMSLQDVEDYCRGLETEPPKQHFIMKGIHSPKKAKAPTIA